MAKVRITEDQPIYDGMPITFKAPCDCTAVDGMIVYFRIVTDETTEYQSQEFTFKDSHGNDLTGLGNLFSEGAYVRVILDTANGYAFIQNAATNGYLEEKLGVDYIVEQGTSGDWTYRKWNSGIAELWASVSVTTTMTDTLGSSTVHKWGSYFPNPEYPFDLYEPNVQFTPYYGNGPAFGFVISGNYTSNNKPPLYAPFIFENRTESFTFIGRYYVMARWK